MSESESFSLFEAKGICLSIDIQFNRAVEAELIWAREVVIVVQTTFKVGAMQCIS